MSHQPQWQPTNPPVPPARQKSWFARHTALSIVLGICLVVVLICCGAGVASMSGDTESDSGASTTQETTDSAKETAASKSSSKRSPAKATKEKREPKAETKEPAVEPAEPAEPEMTTEQENAIRAAENYLEFMPFSKQGLIDQLSSDAGDGYPQDVAEFAVDNIDVDYNTQAKKAAKNYMDTMPFSKQGLIDQLSSEAGDGYTQEQAEYGADQVM